MRPLFAPAARKLLEFVGEGLAPPATFKRVQHREGQAPPLRFSGEHSSPLRMRRKPHPKRRTKSHTPHQEAQRVDAQCYVNRPHSGSDRRAERYSRLMRRATAYNVTNWRPPGRPWGAPLGGVLGTLPLLAKYPAPGGAELPFPPAGEKAKGRGGASPSPTESRSKRARRRGTSPAEQSRKVKNCPPKGFVSLSAGNFPQKTSLRGCSARAGLPLTGRSRRVRVRS